MGRRTPGSVVVVFARASKRLPRFAAPLAAAVVLVASAFVGAVGPLSPRSGDDATRIEPGLISITSTGKRMAFTGTLTEATTGAPLAGAFGLRFRIFPAATGTAVHLWEETQPSVSVSQGRFTVLLGSTTPFPDRLFDGSDRFLEIQVNGVTLAPRVELARVASSFFADLAADLECVTACVTAAEVAADAIVTGAIANGTIAMEDLNASTISAFRASNQLIGSADLAVDAVNSSAIANGGILIEDLATSTSNAFRLSTAAIGLADLSIEALADLHEVLSEEIVDGAVSATDLAEAVLADMHTVVSSELVDGTVLAQDLAAAVVQDIDNVDATELAAAITDDIHQVLSNEIVNGTILAEDLAATLAQDIDNIDASELAAAITDDIHQVLSTEIVDATIVAEDLAQTLADDINNVDASEIVDQTIGLTDLAAALVTDIHQVVSSELVDGTILAEDLAASLADDINNVDATEIVDNTIGLADLATTLADDIHEIVSTELVDGTILAQDLADSLAQDIHTVVSSELANGTILAEDLSTTLADDINNVDATEIVDNTIGLADLATTLADDIHEIVSGEIAAGAVLATHLAQTLNDDINNVDASEIVDGEITLDDINDATESALRQTAVGEGAVGARELADTVEQDIDNVDSTEIVDATIAVADLSQALADDINNVDTAEIVDGTITLDDINDATEAALRQAAIGEGAIGTRELADSIEQDIDRVDTAEVALQAITSALIADGTIQTDDLANGSVTLSKLHTDVVGALGAVPRPGATVARVGSVATALMTQTPAIAVGTDGLPIVAYQGSNATSIVVARCKDIACAATPSAVTISPAGANPVIEIGSDGLPVIGYAGGVIHCNDPACVATTQHSGLGGTRMAVAIGHDGHTFLDTGLQLRRCDTVTCATSFALRTWTDEVASDIVLGTDGAMRPIKAGHEDWQNDTGARLNIWRCAAYDTRCTNISLETTVSLTANIGTITNVDATIGGDGLLFVVARGTTGSAGVHCNDASCSTTTVTTLSPATVAGAWGLTVGTDGLPLITLPPPPSSPPPSTVAVHCSNAACSTFTVTRLLVDTGQQPALMTGGAVTTGSDGLPIVFGVHGNDIRTHHCANRFCVPYARY